jgi:hypothetical protein
VRLATLREAGARLLATEAELLHGGCDALLSRIQAFASVHPPPRRDGPAPGGGEDSGAAAAPAAVAAEEAGEEAGRALALVMRQVAAKRAAAAARAHGAAGVVRDVRAAAVTIAKAAHSGELPACSAWSDARALSHCKRDERQPLRASVMTYPHHRVARACTSVAVCACALFHSRGMDAGPRCLWALHRVSTSGNSGADTRQCNRRILYHRPA